MESAHARDLHVQPANRVRGVVKQDTTQSPEINYRTGEYASVGIKEARALHERLFRALGVSEIHHWSGPQGAGHIMGTCRMGDDPKTSVVDRELRVHGHHNCFVVSSAVWPTVGTANPTLTLAALSLRAVDAIRQALK